MIIEHINDEIIERFNPTKSQIKLAKDVLDRNIKIIRKRWENDYDFILEDTHFIKKIHSHDTIFIERITPRYTFETVNEGFSIEYNLGRHGIFKNVNDFIDEWEPATIEEYDAFTNKEIELEQYKLDQVINKVEEIKHEYYGKTRRI